MTEPRRRYRKAPDPTPLGPDRLQWDTGADFEKVATLCEAMVAAYEAYVSDHETGYVDAFMGVHNFHKVVILDLIKRTEMDAEQARFFRDMAATTFEEAMRRGR